VYLARRADGAWLLERRPDRGLLGGMLGWPTSDWCDAPDPAPPLVADWRSVGEVRHTFTHFHLRLDVQVAQADGTPERGAFLDRAAFRPSDLPTLMAKAYSLAQTAMKGD